MCFTCCQGCIKDCMTCDVGAAHALQEVVAALQRHLRTAPRQLCRGDIFCVTLRPCTAEEGILRSLHGVSASGKLGLRPSTLGLDLYDAVCTDAAHQRVCYSARRVRRRVAHIRKASPRCNHAVLVPLCRHCTSTPAGSCILQGCHSAPRDGAASFDGRDRPHGRRPVGEHTVRLNCESHTTATVRECRMPTDMGGHAHASIGALFCCYVANCMAGAGLG